VIRPVGDGQIIGVGGGTPLRFVEVEPWVYREVGSAYLGTLVFRQGEGGEGTFAFVATSPFFAMERMSWHATATLHLSLLVASLALALVAVLGWAVAGVRSLVGRRSGLRRPFSSLSLIAGLSGVVVLATIGALYLSLGDTVTFLSYGLSLAMRIFGPVTLLLGLVAAGVAAPAWRTVGTPLPRRLHISLGALAALLLAAELVYWNLLGF